MKTAIILNILINLIYFQFIGSISWASSDSSSENQNQETSLTWYRQIDSQWGGHLKLRESVSWLDHNSFYRLTEDGPFYDTGVNARLKNKTYLNETIYLIAHYEIQYSGGDTRKANNRLGLSDPSLANNILFSNLSMDDDSRFFDLTKSIHETDNQTLYHRFDRLSITFQPDWGMIRMGRQAVTWGNGLVFNPMDLFNPFAPTDVERDYKVGDDMIYTQVPISEIGDIQFLYLPRRDPLDRHLTWSRTSAAGKIHFSSGTSEFDVMFARHYQDKIFGFGVSGFLLDAAWRIDGVWNIIGEDVQEDDFLTLIANIDYSWTWWQKNFYGFIEFYYNGLGNTDYDEAIVNPVITERISRGNLFVLGRKYLAAGIRIELHPLVQTQINMIRNLSDSSGIIQPQIAWDVAENFQITLGGSIYYGGSDSEFGGFEIPGTSYSFVNSDQAYILLTHYF